MLYSFDKNIIQYSRHTELFTGYTCYKFCILIVTDCVLQLDDIDLDRILQNYC